MQVIAGSPRAGHVGLDVAPVLKARAPASPGGT